MAGNAIFSCVRSGVVGVILLASAAAGARAGAAEQSAPPAWLGEAFAGGWGNVPAPCRELAAKLKPDDALVHKHLAQARERLDMLRRSSMNGYKCAAAAKYVHDLLADLAAGTEPWKRYAGKHFGFPYWQPAIADIEVLWVSIPASYDPARKYQFFMFHKTGSGTYFDKGRAAGGPGYNGDALYAKVDTVCCWSSIYRGAKGRMGLEYELQYAPPAVARDFGIDPDRVFLAGWSDGGFTSLWLGSHYPHLVAGIAPDCSNWQYSNVEWPSLYNVPTLIVDGWHDGGYVQANFPRWQMLRNMGYDIACLFGRHGHSYEPYYSAEEFPKILDWAKTKKRDPWPKRLRFATWNLLWPRCYWLSVYRVVVPALAAQFDARVTGNRIDVRMWNVAVYKLALSPKLLDASKPVTVTTNGKESYAGAFRQELTIEVVTLPTGKYRKSSDCPDEITAQFQASTYNSKGFLSVAFRPWLAVRPTGGDEKTRAAMAKWTLPAPAKNDTEITDADLDRYNLLIFGGPDINRLTARIASDLPVKFQPGRITVGAKVYGQPTNCVKFIHPNPLNPKRYVVVYAANDPPAAAAHDFYGLHHSSPWTFREGDCQVAGIPPPPRKWGVAIGPEDSDSDWFLFDANWGTDYRPVGELAGPFDFTQIQDLRADAIREATGADVGLVPSPPPGWARWKQHLPAGPVTLNDLAVTQMFPEYVTLFEVKGSRLAEMVGGAFASTVPAGKGGANGPHSGPHAADFQPDKTYTVACSGLPASYGIEAAKAPPLLYWETPEQFIAGGGSLGLSNLRQSTVQVPEALARYIATRGKVRPRVRRDDLMGYILNPRDNQFDACDWLHLGLDGDWKDLAGEKPGPFRYTLNLGLKAAGQAQDAPPPMDAKRFLDVSLSDKARRTESDFGRFGRKLPVTAAVELKAVAIGPGTEGAPYNVLPDAADKTAIARAVLVNVRLTNKGRSDVSGVAVLAAMAQMRHFPNVFGRSEGKAKHYMGMFEDYRNPARAATLLLGPAAGKADTMVVPGAGYDQGFLGVKIEVAIQAGASVSVPVVLLATDRPVKTGDRDPGATGLPALAEAVYDDLLKTAGGK